MIGKRRPHESNEKKMTRQRGIDHDNFILKKRNALYFFFKKMYEGKSEQLRFFNENMAKKSNNTT